MKEGIHFEITSFLGKRIRVTKDYWNRIIETKHTIMKGKEEAVKDTLKNPDELRVSRKDKKVFLYYKKLNEKYSCVVAKHLNGDGFIITTYMTDSSQKSEIFGTPKMLAFSMESK